METKYPLKIYTAGEICQMAAYGLAQLSLFSTPVIFGQTNFSFAATAFAISLVYSGFKTSCVSKRKNSAPKMELQNPSFPSLRPSDDLRGRIENVSRFLKLKKLPEVHMTDNFFPNAGVDIYGDFHITSGFAQHFNAEQKNACICHEGGHLLAMHCHFNAASKFMFNSFVMYSAFLSGINSFSLQSIALSLALCFSFASLNKKMMRLCEYQADRLGATITRPDDMISVLKTIDNFNEKTDIVYNAADWIEVDEPPLFIKVVHDVVDLLGDIFNLINPDHPTISSRVDRLQKQKEAMKHGFF